MKRLRRQGAANAVPVKTITTERCRANARRAPRQRTRRQLVELPQMTLIERIQSTEARVVVMGIGYVGLPLVAEFARAGFRTTGLDQNKKKVELVNAGGSYISDVASSDLAPHV